MGVSAGATPAASLSGEENAGQAVEVHRGNAIAPREISPNTQRILAMPPVYSWYLLTASWAGRSLDGGQSHSFSPTGVIVSPVAPHYSKAVVAENTARLRIVKVCVSVEKRQSEIRRWQTTNGTPADGKPHRPAHIV